MSLEEIRSELEQLKEKYWMYVTMPINIITKRDVDKRNELDKRIAQLERLEAQF